jgi:hypothetical protein
MKDKLKEQWIKLCEQTADEQDAANLHELVIKINRLLDEKTERLEGKTSSNQ